MGSGDGRASTGQQVRASGLAFEVLDRVIFAGSVDRVLESTRAADPSQLRTVRSRRAGMTSRPTGRTSCNRWADTIRWRWRRDRAPSAPTRRQHPGR